MTFASCKKRKYAEANGDFDSSMALDFIDLTANSLVRSVSQTIGSSGDHRQSDLLMSILPMYRPDSSL